MIWASGKTSQRRKEIRRAKAGRKVAWHRRVTEQLPVWGIGLTVIIALLAALIVNIGGEVLPFRVGQFLPRAITARTEFRIEDEQQTAEMRQRERAAAPLYYRLDTSLLDDIRGRLINATTVVKNNLGKPDQLAASAAEEGLVLDEPAVAKLTELAQPEKVSEYEAAVEAALRRLANEPLVEPDAASVRRSAALAILVDARTRTEREIARGKLLQATDEEALQRAASEAARAFPVELRPAFERSLLALLHDPDQNGAGRALYLYDKSRSDQAAQLAAQSVTQRFLSYKPGDVLADRGPLTAAEFELLRREDAEFRNALPTDNHQPGRWVAVLGRALLTVLVVVGVASYMSRYQRVITLNPLRGLLTAGVLLLMLVIARLLYLLTDFPPHVAVGVQAFAAGLLALVYAHGSIFAIGSALAVLITIATGRGVDFLLVLLAVAGTLMFVLRDVRSRGKIVGVGFAAALVAFNVTIAASLIAGQTFGYTMYQALWAGGTTLLAAFILEGILPGIERLFRLSTSLTLLELCDPNRPLLRMMAAEAPGTYNHSMLVGTLAEAAAEAIGANGLLTRAGAFYHDIGKINKPGYFVENQLAGVSRHERLSPAMSLLIIIGHVKDGIEMAKEYGLPKSLLPFIAEHHGTTLVEYFYHAANKQRKPGDPEVPDTEFRYPGPKPQSRETAVLMLCDAVEGAVRAMSEPTPNRIEAVVSEIVRRRLIDGQFDECDLTFRELEMIERSLVKSLCGIYHARIVYPDRDEEKKTVERHAS